jgi:hypothetical protein
MSGFLLLLVVVGVVAGAHGGSCAHFGSAVMPDLSPECAPKRTSVDRSEFMVSRPKFCYRSIAANEMLMRAIYVNDSNVIWPVQSCRSK